MNHQNRKFGPPGLTLACALALASSAWAANVITTDKINGYEGVLQGPTAFVPSTRPGAVAGDYALDLTTAGGGVLVANAGFLNAVTANDKLAISFWVKKYDMADSSAFWIHATSQDRAFQAHTPWSNDNIYFDTSGCCDGATQRISAPMTSLVGYPGAAWWDDWHHFVFFKNGADKQIWIDGQLFLQGSSTAPLPTDISYLFIGGTAVNGGLMHGQMDDFAMFANALSPDDIVKLSTGTAPDALGGANQLVAYWDFDVPLVSTPTGFTVNVKDVGTSPMAPNTVELSLDGTAVTPTSVTKSGSVTVIPYVLPNPPFLPGSTHTATVNIKDTSGASFTYDYSFAVAMFGLLSSDMALPPASVNKSLKGFKFRTYQVDGVNAGNGVQAAEDTLAGEFGPNVAYLEDLGGVDARGYFSFTEVINLDILDPDNQATPGRFTLPDYPEYPFPGIPGNSGNYTNFSCELYTALEFTQAGLYTMVVNSDDCFATTSGPNPLDTLGAAQLGRFDAPGGRGSADTSFQLFVQTPGLYGFRTIYQQGTGGGNLEWFMVNDNGVRVLINDITNAIPAYQWLPTITAAYVKSFTPADEEPAALPSLVQAVVVDGSASAGLFGLRIDDVPVQLTITKVGKENTLTYVPDPLFTAGSSHTARLTFTDGPNIVTHEWSFTVAPYTKDVLNDYVGLLRGTTKYAPASDRPFATSNNQAIDPTGGGVFVADASFLNLATANDIMTFAFWCKKYDMAANSAFWAISPSSSSTSRGFQAHVPWSDNTVYFDTAGCCDGTTQRINASLTTFPAYTDATWWDDWHHWVFFKNGADKQVWIDGQLFLQGSSTAPLPTDMTSLWIGNAADGNILHGQLDDFAVFATALSPTDIQALANGTAPDALPQGTSILAYWPFDDAPVSVEPTISLDATGNIIYTGTLQHADSVTGSWTDVEGATSPYTMPKTGAMKYYRSWQ